MNQYFQFLGCLAVGMVGVGMVLTVLIERLFADWDVVGELGVVMREGLAGRRLSQDRAEDVMLEVEKKNAGLVNTRIDQRRQQLADVASAERRLQVPNKGAITLTPLPAPRLAGNVETLPPVAR